MVNGIGQTIAGVMGNVLGTKITIFGDQPFEVEVLCSTCMYTLKYYHVLCLLYLFQSGMTLREF